MQAHARVRRNRYSYIGNVVVREYALRSHAAETYPGSMAYRGNDAHRLDRGTPPAFGVLMIAIVRLRNLAGA
jgi:hypothetical protein